MTNRNTRRGKLAFLLIALVVLAVLQPRHAKVHLAAELEHAAAQNALGIMYFNGHGVPQNYQEAVK